MLEERIGDNALSEAVAMGIELSANLYFTTNVTSVD